MRNIPTATLNLLIIIIIVFVAQKFVLPGYGIDQDMFALHYPDSPRFRLWQIITHMFCHDLRGYWHVLFNGFALLTFGSHIERVIGSKRFLLLFFVSGLTAVLVHFGYTAIALNMKYGSIMPFKQGLILADIYAPMVGASGALYGISVAFAMFFPNLELIFLIIPYPIKAKYLVPIIIAIDLILGFLQLDHDNIAHFAHIGGAIGGFLLCRFVLRASFRRNY